MNGQIVTLSIALASALVLSGCSEELQPPQKVNSDLGYGADLPSAFDLAPVGDQGLPVDLAPVDDGKVPKTDIGMSVDTSVDGSPPAPDSTMVDGALLVDQGPIAQYSLTPATPAHFTGEVGGPFSKTQFTYVLANLGATSFQYSVGFDQPWLKITPTTGTVGPAQATQLVVELGPTIGSLSGGVHANAMTVTVGQTKQERLIEVTVINPGDTAFTKASNNPLISKGPSGSWNENGSVAPTVINTGTEYVMLYFGIDAQGNASIGQANSPDGKTWTPYTGNPIIGPGDPNEWNALIEGPAGLVVDGSGTLHTWYTTIDSQGLYHTAHASAAAGAGSWTVSPNSVFEPGSAGTWDSARISLGAVVLDNGTYKMWYLGYSPTSTYEDTSVGYATSVDGLAWNRFSNNPVHTAPGESWDSLAIMRDKGVFRMWRVLRDKTTQTTIGVYYGDSTNGVNWTFQSGPVLVPDPGKWDAHSIVGLSVQRYSPEYLDLWYSGCTGNFVDCTIGYATNP
jgi:hypothetical protein